VIPTVGGTFVTIIGGGGGEGRVLIGGLTSILVISLSLLSLLFCKESRLLLKCCEAVANGADIVVNSCKWY